MKRRIIFIQNGQFGYDFTTYNIINELSNSYDIKYLGIDENHPCIDPINENITIYNLIIRKKGILGKVEFRDKVLEIINHEKWESDPIHFFYYMFCSDLVLRLGKRKTIVDYRTGYISNHKLITLLKNLILAMEARLFTHTTTLSESLKRFLKLPKSTAIVELGANLPIIESDLSNADLKTLKFLYVGTLNQRKIDVFVKGLAHYYSRNHKDFGVLTIIGGGNVKEQNRLRDAISICPKNLSVKYIGSKKPHELGPFYANHSVGVSFVPIERKYNYQPVTKSIEYLVNGLFIFGTKTVGNQEILNKNNSVLVNDTVIDVAKKLTVLKNQIKNHDRIKTMKEAEKYYWSNILKQQLVPIINRIV